MSSRWGTERVEIAAPGTYRDGPRFEERPRARPREITVAAVAAMGLAVLRCVWLLWFAYPLTYLSLGYDFDPGFWPEVLIAPGALLCAQLLRVTWMTTRRSVHAARALRTTAMWLCVQQFVVVMAVPAGLFATWRELTLALIGLVLALAAASVTWRVARALLDAALALDALDAQRWQTASTLLPSGSMRNAA